MPSFGTLAMISAHLSSVDARGGCGIVLVVTPRRMSRQLVFHRDALEVFAEMLDPILRLLVAPGRHAPYNV